MARSLPESSTTGAVVVAALAILAALAFVGLKHRHAHAAEHVAARELAVPRAPGPIVDDGDADEPGWPTAAQGGAFVDASGAEAHPHSELRFAWDATGLHVLAYAADGDIEPTDAITLQVGVGPSGHVVTTTPREVVIDGAPVTVGHDVDGTVGDPRDDDEEWVTEVTIPWSVLGAGLRGRAGERVELSAVRCDDPREGGRRCGAMRDTVLLLQ